jgi:hypothetical protein
MPCQSSGVAAAVIMEARDPRKVEKVDNQIPCRCNSAPELHSSKQLALHLEGGLPAAAAQNRGSTYIDRLDMDN